MKSAILLACLLVASAQAQTRDLEIDVNLSGHVKTKEPVVLKHLRDVDHYCSYEATEQPHIVVHFYEGDNIVFELVLYTDSSFTKVQRAASLTILAEGDEWTGRGSSSNVEFQLTATLANSKSGNFNAQNLRVERGFFARSSNDSWVLHASGKWRCP